MLPALYQVIRPHTRDRKISLAPEIVMHIAANCSPQAKSTAYVLQLIGCHCTFQDTVLLADIGRCQVSLCLCVSCSLDGSRSARVPCQVTCKCHWVRHRLDESITADLQLPAIRSSWSDGLTTADIYRRLLHISNKLCSASFLLSS